MKITPINSYHFAVFDIIPAQFPGQLRSDLVAEAEKPPLPWELARLGARAAVRAKKMGGTDALQGGATARA